MTTQTLYRWMLIGMLLLIVLAAVSALAAANTIPITGAADIVLPFSAR